MKWLPKWSAKTVIIHSLVVCAFLASALALSQQLLSNIPTAFMLLFLFAVGGATWLTGTWSGMASVLLACVLVAHYFAPPLLTSGPFFNRFNCETLPYFLTFTVMATVLSLMVSNRRNLERKLWEKQEWMRYTVTAAEVGAWEWDMESGKITWSDNMESLHGQEHGFFKGTFESFLEGAHPEDRERLIRRISPCKNVGDQCEFEYRPITVSGDLKWVMGRGQIVCFHGKNKMMGVCVDVTKHKQAQEALKTSEHLIQEKNTQLTEALELRNRFIGSMSHELRTPMNSIIGFTGTLLMGLPGPLNDTQRHQLKTIQNSAKHLLNLINDLLDLRKIDAGRISVKFEPIICQNVISYVMESMSPFAFKKQLKLEMAMPADPILIKTDERVLKQILFNLINNAIKFTNEGGITVSVSKDSRINISVKDTGIGIKEEDKAKLFQAFSRVGLGNRTDQGGAGLGLHLSQKLAQLLGGKIVFDSDYGRGTTFTLSLPDMTVLTKAVAS